MTEKDKQFIRDVAKDYNIIGLTDEQIETAHKLADYNSTPANYGQDYYDFLKSYFGGKP